MGMHSDRVAVITGAASGIGRAAAQRFLDEGGSVVLLDRAAEGLAWALGNPSAAAVVGDVTDAATNDETARVALERFGRLDAAVLNAGIPMSGDLLTMPMSELERVLSVNVAAVVLGIRSAVPAMRLGGGGSIVVTASTSGLGGDPGMWPYNTSKGAVVNLVRAAALDLASEGIRVNAVCPGPTETAMTARIQTAPEVYDDLRRRIPLQRWGQPHEVAAVICFLASADAGFVTGAVIPVDGGLTASTGQFLPRAIAGDTPGEDQR